MIIRYTDGRTFNAVLLSRTETTMRLALENHDDVAVLTRVHDAWVSDECELVQVDFAWARPEGVAEVKLEDCICSHELAAHLIHLLHGGDDEVASGTIAVPRELIAAALLQVV